MKGPGLPKTSRSRLLERALGATSDVIYVFDLDGSLRLWNERLNEVTGYGDAELASIDPRELVASEDHHRLARHLGDLEASGTSTLEARLETKEGVEIPYQFFSNRVTGQNGADLGRVGVGRDVTERRDREQQIAERAAAMEASIDGMAILNEDGEYAFVNQAHADIYGYDDPKEFTGENWQMCYTDDELDRMQGEVMEVLSAEGHWRGEGVGTRRDGSTFPQELSLTVMETGRLVCVVRDVTERKERQQRLRETNRQLQGILDTTTAAVFLKDTKGRYELVNTRCREILGFGDRDVIGKTDYDLFPEEIADRFTADDSRVLENGESVRIEEEVPTENGPRTFLTLKNPVRDDSGEVTGLCAVSTDITERVEYKRTVERQNERLDEVATIISHDLRNPLNVASGHLTLVSDDCDSEHVDAVGLALDRMDRIIDGALDLARSGQELDELEPVDLGRQVERCWQTVATTGAEIVVEDLPTISADPDQLCRLFENLFRNAVEHGSTSSRTPSDDGAEDGKADVTVRTNSLPDGFCVEDDGPGIPEQERESVLETGYSTREEGTGFGLAIVSRIATAHGWDVRVTESESGGARFEITGVEIRS